MHHSRNTTGMLYEKCNSRMKQPTVNYTSTRCSVVKSFKSWLSVPTLFVHLVKGYTRRIWYLCKLASRLSHEELPARKQYCVQSFYREKDWTIDMTVSRKQNNIHVKQREITFILIVCMDLVVPREIFFSYWI